MCEKQGFSLRTMYLVKESCRDIERGDSWFEVESYSDLFIYFFQLITKTNIYLM